MGCAFYSDCKKCIEVAKNKCEIYNENKILRDALEEIIKEYESIVHSEFDGTSMLDDMLNVGIKAHKILNKLKEE